MPHTQIQMKMETKTHKKHKILVENIELNGGSKNEFKN